MVKLILLIGLPGSGKSSLARQMLAENSHRQLISTDAIRNQLFGDEAQQGPWLLIWREVQRQFQQAVIQISSTATVMTPLASTEDSQMQWSLNGEKFGTQVADGGEAIYDATNAQRRHRREIIELARATGFTHITGLWLDTPVWLCLARNRRRVRQVPEDVILRMHRQFQDAPPNLQEGLDRLIRA